MTENDQPAPAGSTGTPLTYGRAGAIGGAGFAAGIFSTLGLAKILANPDASYTPAYPLAVFGMVALFILISAIVLVPMSKEGTRFAWFGVIAFSALAASGAYIFYEQLYYQPAANVGASLNTDLSRYNKRDNLQLLLKYTAGKDAGTLDVAGKRIRLSSGDVIAIQLDGLDDVDRVYDKYRNFKNLAKILCVSSGHVQSSDAGGICANFKAQMQTDDDADMSAEQS